MTELSSVFLVNFLKSKLDQFIAPEILCILNFVIFVGAVSESPKHLNRLP